MWRRVVSTAEPDFAGHLGLTHDESRPAHPPPVHPPAGAPNVVVIVLDDVGFAQLGCYGSDIATPNIDRLASTGTQYTNFHVTPLCSPTRAALLSGRNHHTVGMGTITGFPGGYPSSREHVSHRARMLPRILHDRGYGTYAVGKWHLLPMDSMTAAGRFDHWPLNEGFDRFYGFHGGESDQYRPTLVVDNHLVEPPDRPGYHLSEDLVDVAGDMIADHRSAAPTRPFFLYLAFGACHGPHQAPPEYIERYRGRYDDGWDVARRRWWERQLELGVIPAGTELNAPNPDVEPWESLDDDERRLAARFHEVFAGFLEHTDAQIGRLLERLERLDARDDTVVIVVSDNGASGEGGPLGDWNEVRALNGLPMDVRESMERIDEMGSASTYPLYPRGWGQAGNTPLKWYKHFTFGGGVRAALVVDGLPDGAGTIDGEFHHVTDVVPTVLELCGVTAPQTIDGIEQLPLVGRSLLHTANRTDGADAGDPRTQYFEMLGHRGLYHDGMKAVSRHEAGADYATESWELYDLRNDFAETHDLAAERPELLRQMIDRWWVEAGRHGVLPLDDRFLERAQDRTGTDLDGVTHSVLYRGMSRLPESAAPDLRAPEFTVSTVVHDLADDHRGVIMSFGGRFGGFVWYLDDRHLVLAANCFGAIDTIRSDEPLPSGDVDVALHWVRSGEPGGPATITLSANGRQVGTGTLPHTIPYYAGGNGIELGANRLSAVIPTLPTGFEFTGRFDRVEIVVATDDEAPGVATSVARAD